jgi:hypothetical protein
MAISGAPPSTLPPNSILYESPVAVVGDAIVAWQRGTAFGCFLVCGDNPCAYDSLEDGEGVWTILDDVYQMVQ